GTAGVVVRAPALQSTASCFISPLAGVRLPSRGPTNPTGTEAAGQPRHAVGWGDSEGGIRPGEKLAETAGAGQVLQAIDCGTAALLWNIGIGSVSVRAVTTVIEVPT